MTNRPSWDEYFLEILESVASRATCNRGKSAAIITLDNRILTTGYVGAPSGIKDCDSAGHMLKEVIYEGDIKKQHCIRSIHAEQNAILQAARYGIKIDGAALYCTMTPCFDCTKLIVGVGIKRVVAKNEYKASSLSHDLFKEAGIELKIINNEVLKYE